MQWKKSSVNLLNIRIAASMLTDTKSINDLNFTFVTENCNVLLIGTYSLLFVDRFIYYRPMRI